MAKSSRRYTSGPAALNSGAYALTGFLYQLLGSLDWASAVTLTSAPSQVETDGENPSGEPLLSW